MSVENIEFDVQALLANTEMCKLFNQQIELGDEGLFGSMGSQPTLNGLMIVAMVPDSVEEHGIWDSDIHIDLVTNQFVICGNEYPSGGGSRITAAFNGNGTPTSIKCEVRMGGVGSLEEAIEVYGDLTLFSVQVEPFCYSDYDKIKSAFFDVVK